MRIYLFTEFYKFAPSIRIRLIANFLRKLCTQVVVPFMTINLASQYGNIFAGSITILILIGGGLINLYGGVLTEKIIPTKILQLSEICHLLCIIFMILYLNHQFMLIFFYFLKNIFFSLSIPSGELIVMEDSYQENRRAVYTINNMLNNLSIPIGILLGGFLYGYGMRYLLIIAAIASMLVLYMYFQLTPSNKLIINKHHTLNFSLSYIINNKQALYFLFATILLFTIEFSFLQYFAVTISNQKNLTLFFSLPLSGVESFSILRAENSLISIFLAVVMIKFIEKFNDIYQLSVLVLITTISFFTLLYSTNLNHMILLVGIMSFVDTIINPALQTLYVNNIGNEHKGLFLSLYSLTGRMANILAGFILAVSTTIGHTLTSIIVLMFGIISAGFILISFKIR